VKVNNIYNKPKINAKNKFDEMKPRQYEKVKIENVMRESK